MIDLKIRSNICSNVAQVWYISKSDQIFAQMLLKYDHISQNQISIVDQNWNHVAQMSVLFFKFVKKMLVQTDKNNVQKFSSY